MEKKINVYMDTELFEYIKFYFNKNNLKLREELPLILELGWKEYKKEKNIKV